jgi:hypothetical protein
MHAFPTPRKIVTVTIEDDGNAVFLATDSADVFLEMGTVITRRASHVEPAPRYERWLFTILRFLFSDTSKVAAWTRTWNTLWRVNTRPVGGPILTWGHIWDAKGHPATVPWIRGLSQYNLVACFAKRQDAIDAEVRFLNTWFAERGL